MYHILHINLKSKLHLKVKYFIACLLILITSLSFSGNGYQIKKHVISNSAQISEGSGYKLTGTTGQPIIDQSSSGSYRIRSGFWHRNADLIFKNSFE